MTRRGPWLLVVLALLPALAACERTKTKEAAPGPPPPAVVVAEVVQQTVPIVTEFIARTDAVQTVEIRARVEAVLEEVLFKEGSEVKKGQTLFQLQRTEYDAALQRAHAQLAKAQADLSRAQETAAVEQARAQLDQRRAALAKTHQDVARFRPLAEAKAVPQVDLDNAIAADQVSAAGVEAAAAALKDAELAQRIGILEGKAAVEAGRAAVIQAELNLSYTTIKAPADGIIGRLAVDRGNLVGRGESTLLATMSTYDPIKVAFTVSEADYLRFAKTGAGRAAAEAGPSLDLILADGSVFPHRGRLTTLERALDEKTGTIAVEAQFPNPEKLLRPGQFARVRTAVEQRPNALLVPQRAIQEVQGAKSVLVVGLEDKVALRTVALAERVGDLVIVTSGVQPGDKVIVEGMQKVRPGMAVKPELRPLAPGGAPAAGAPPAASAPGAPPAGVAPPAAPTPAPKSGG